MPGNTNRDYSDLLHLEVKNKKYSNRSIDLIFLRYTIVVSSENVSKFQLQQKKLEADFACQFDWDLSESRWLVAPGEPDRASP